MLWTGEKIRNGPHVGTVATQPLPYGVSNSLQEGQNQKWPTCGHNGYLTPAVSAQCFAWGTKPETAHMWAQWLFNGCRLGGPQCFGRGTKSEMAHMWVLWLRNPCRFGGPQCFGRRTKSEVAHKWAQCLHNPWHQGSPQCFARGQNQKWPRNGQGGYITPAA